MVLRLLHTFITVRRCLITNDSLLHNHETMATGSISLAVAPAGKPSELLVPWTGSTLCAFCCDILCSGAVASCAVKMLKISAARGCGLCRFLYEELVVTNLPTSTSDSKLEFRNEDGCIEIVDQEHRRHRYEIYSIDSKSNSAQQASSTFWASLRR